MAFLYLKLEVMALFTVTDFIRCVRNETIWQELLNAVFYVKPCTVFSYLAKFDFLEPVYG